MEFQRRTGLRLTLILIAILGMWFAVHWSLKAQRLQADFQRLAIAVGHLPVDDPTKVYVACVPSDEKLVWRFRIYLPANYESREIYGSGQIAADSPRQKFASHGWSSHGPNNVPSEF